jgi:hypothetical protein
LEPSSVDVVVPVELKDNDKNAQKGKEKTVPNVFHIVRVPRLAGDDVWARVQEAQGHLDRLTQERDALNVRRKKQKVTGLRMFSPLLLP